MVNCFLLTETFHSISHWCLSSLHVGEMPIEFSLYAILQQVANT